MTQSITIENVDTSLLEDQRLALIRTLFVLDTLNVVSDEDKELLNGLAHLLDHWSDSRL